MRIVALRLTGKVAFRAVRSRVRLRQALARCVSAALSSISHLSTQSVQSFCADGHKSLGIFTDSSFSAFFKIPHFAIKIGLTFPPLFRPFLPVFAPKKPLVVG